MGAQAQGRVAFVAVDVGAQGLVAVDVEGADGHRPRAHDLHHVPVLVVKLVLAGKIRAVHVLELGAVQPDAVAAVVEHRDHLFWQFDVAEHLQMQPVAGFGRQVAVAGDTRLVVLVAGPAFLVLHQGLFAGMHDHHAGHAVNDDDVVAVDGGAGVVEAQHGRNFQAAGDDAGVRGPAALVGDKALDAFELDLAGIGRGQVPRHEHDPLVDGRDVLAARAGEAGHDPIGHLVDVLDPFAKIGVGHLIEHLVDGAGHLVQSPLGVDPFGLDGIEHLAVEQLVLEQDPVGLEDLAVALELFGRVGDDGADLVAGLLDGRLETAAFVRQVVGADRVALDDPHPLAVYQVGLADADARRGADAVEAQFLGRVLVRHGWTTLRIPRGSARPKAPASRDPLHCRFRGSPRSPGRSPRPGCR